MNKKGTILAKLRQRKQLQIKALRANDQRRVLHFFPEAFCMLNFGSSTDKYVIVSDRREQHRLGAGPTPELAWQQVLRLLFTLI